MEQQYKNLLVAFVIATFLPNVLSCWRDTTSLYEADWQKSVDMCGTHSDNGNKIVNGNNVADTLDWPWLGFMKKSGSFICTVELIAPEWATTAAHCVVGVAAYQLSVTFGQANMASSSGYTQTRGVSQIVIHQGYSGTTIRNDIAVLHLTSSVSYTTRVRPVCMQGPGINNDDSWDDNCWVAGWGRLSTGGTLPNYLQELKVDVLGSNNADCKAKASSPYGHLVTPNHICVEGIRANSGSCPGDSGGPLMCRVWDSNLWLLLGINSFRTNVACAADGKPDVFTRVSSYSQWISDVIDARGGPGTF